jgi:hypothetical protein
MSRPLKIEGTVIITILSAVFGQTWPRAGLAFVDKSQ